MIHAAVVELFSSGREQELELLTREYEQSRTRACARFAFVHGPTGIGKSYLMRALRRSLASRGVQVFEGASSRALPAAYGLLAGLVPGLLDYLGELGIPGRVIAELSRRVGPLCGGDAPERLSPEERRLDLYDALAELFALASAGSPCFLLADADAADRDSLELLRYLAASALAPGARSGGLFVVSYRDDAPLPAPLSELISRVPGLNLPLSGLDLEGIRAFLARRDVAERLLEATGGLPTALEEAVAGPCSAPADLFERRLATFDSTERAALLAIAVHGEPADSRVLGTLLARAFSTPADGLDRALERLVRERLVEARPLVGASVHAIARSSFRDALLARAGPEDLASLHAALGELLSERGGDPQAVARHFLAAEPQGRGALAALEAADALAGRAAFDEAAELYRLALEALPQVEKAPVRVRLARALRGGGDYSGALRELALARRALDPAQQRALLAEAATLAKLLGRLSAAELLCRKVLGPSASPEDGDAAKAFVVYADVLFLRGKYDEARAHCERGIEAHAAHPELALSLRNTLGKTLLTQGAYEEAAAVFAQNAALARETSLPREQARALINQGIVSHRRGDRRGAVALYRAALALSGAERGLSALALSNLGSLYADSAEFEPAVAHLSKALSAFTRAGRSKELAHCALNLARLHLFLGDLDRGGELCDHAAAVASDVGDPYLLASADLVRGEWLEASGCHAKAVESLETAREAFERIKSPRYAAESALALARVHLAHGELGLARGALAHDSIDAAAREAGPLAAERDLVAGELALLGGDLGEAARRLSNAKEQLLENPDLEGPYRVYHLLARLRAAAGDAAGAAAHASRAAQLLEELVSHVPAAGRPAFLKDPRRGAVIAAASGAEREITPGRVARALELAPAGRRADHGLIGSSPALEKVLKVLEPVARSNATVLVRGESGTGKELLAEAIHRNSPRRDMPLVRVNCAAMVEELLLSELFGHEKGAFTGAVRERKGRFELAEGGSIFLDEIGDISPKAQVALLRVLQEREFERVGGTRTLKADVRVICATNRDLESMIAAGSFRQDLYYRLKGVMLELPPLRARLEDLAELADHFLARLAQERGEEKKLLSPEAFEILRAHGWPGNIRELENVLASASIFADGRVITPEAFEHIGELAPLVDERAAPPPAAPPPAPAPSPARDGHDGIDYFEIARQRGLSLKDLRQEIETQCILKALSETRGNISEAARLLGTKRSRLSQIVNADPLLRAAAKG